MAYFGQNDTNSTVEIVAIVIIALLIMVGYFYRGLMACCYDRYRIESPTLVQYQRGLQTPHTVQQRVPGIHVQPVYNPTEAVRLQALTQPQQQPIQTVRYYQPQTANVTTTNAPAQSVYYPQSIDYPIATEVASSTATVTTPEKSI